MSNRTKFIFHIGIPGLVSDLLSEVVQFECVNSRGNTKFFSTRDYRSSLRSWINDKASLTYVVADVSEEIIALKRRLSKYGTVIASQHAMLGSIEQVFGSDQMLPFAEKRVSQLSNMFHEFDLELHVALSSYLDVAQVLTQKGAPISDTTAFLRSPKHWCDLIKRIAQACPDRKIVVWDLDDPRWALPAFAQSVCGLGPEEISSDFQEFISDAARHRYALKKAFSWECEMSEQEGTALQKFYLDDLEKIGKLKNVVLMVGDD